MSNLSNIKYNYNWYNYNNNLMKEFNWFLYKINQRSNIEHKFSNEIYENVDMFGNEDFGLHYDVEYFHPTITLDDRMRFIATKIATSNMSFMNIIGNTLISHFYGARGIHFLVSGEQDVFVDFDRIHENDQDYIKFLRNNLDNAKANKQPIWGTTELHTSIQTASRNYCRKKYNDENRLFHPIDVCEWVASFKNDYFLDRIYECNHMKDIYNLLREQPGIGEYYGFHGAASTSILPHVKYHHDQRFVAPGPGAVYTIKLLWPNVPKKLYGEAIYFLREQSKEIGLIDNVVFHENAYNFDIDNKKLFNDNQDSLKYYGTEVLSCQFGVYLQIRKDKKACFRRRVARSNDIRNGQLF